MDAIDAGCLVAMATDVSLTPGTTGRGAQYRARVERYLADAAFRRLVDDILEGAGCQVADADADQGLLVICEADSPWAWPARSADLPWNKFDDHDKRAARLLAMVAILAYVAPSAADFEDLLSDPQALRPTFTAGDLAQFLRDAAAHQEAHLPDPDGPQRPMWWHLLQLPADITNPHRAARHTLVYLIHQVLQFLHQHGLLVRVTGSTIRDSAYRPRRRLLAQYRLLLVDDLFTQLQSAAADTPQPSDAPKEP